MSDQIGQDQIDAWRQAQQSELDKLTSLSAEINAQSDTVLAASKLGLELARLGVGIQEFRFRLASNLQDQRRAVAMTDEEIVVVLSDVADARELMIKADTCLGIFKKYQVDSEALPLMSAIMELNEALIEYRAIKAVLQAKGFIRVVHLDHGEKTAIDL
jgi:hypothetical protein